MSLWCLMIVVISTHIWIYFRLGIQFFVSQHNSRIYCLRNTIVFFCAHVLFSILRTQQWDNILYFNNNQEIMFLLSRKHKLKCKKTKKQIELNDFNCSAQLARIIATKSRYKASLNGWISTRRRIRQSIEEAVKKLHARFMLIRCSRR